METILVILLAVAGLSLFMTLTFCLAAHWRLKQPPPMQGATPFISVFKPVKGVDDGLYENLASLAMQNYPNFEIIVGAADASDPALDVARHVQRDFPHVDMTIVGCTGSFGYNPKVANLAGMQRYAQGDHWLISDSNVRPPEDYLRALASELNHPDVGLVASLLVGVGEAELGALFENLHLNTFAVGSVCASDLIARHPCVIGKSMFFRKQDLSAVGGFACVKDVLAEDYLLGRAFHQAGLKVKQSTYVLPTVSTQRSVGEFAARHLRWTQLRRWINPPAYLGEALTHPTLWFSLLLVAGLAGASAGGLESAALVWVGAFGLAMKIALDATLIARLRGSVPPLVHLLCIPVKDMLVAGVWIVGGFRRSVSWRGNTYWIGPNSQLTTVPSFGRRLCTLIFKPAKS